MGVKREAAERVLVQALGAVIQAGIESGIPLADIARLLIGGAHQLVGDDGSVT